MRMTMNRRDFLRRASPIAVAAGMLALRPAADGEPKRRESVSSSIPIVDTHQHLWDLSKFRLTWVRPPLDRSFMMKDYLEASRGLGIVQAVYMEVAVPPSQRREEAQYAIDLCQEPGSLTRAAVVAGQPGADGFEPYIRRLRDSPCIKGVRGAFGSVEQMTNEQVIRDLHLLGDLGLRFDLNVAPPFLTEAARLVERCPDTRFILDHCGNADPVAFLAPRRAAPRAPQHAPQPWRESIGRLAARRNVICKISGLVDNVRDYPLRVEDLAPIIDHCLDAFGPERVVFASDWPVCLLGMPLRDWVGLLQTVVAGRPETAQRKLFHDNAVAFYDLGPPNRP
jgi:L-fuconolactonase